MTSLKLFVAPALLATMMAAIPVHAATLTVTSGADSGAGTLRQAILDAAAGDTVNFAAGLTTVTLTSGMLAITRNLTIAGPGANVLTVRRDAAAPAFRIFDTYYAATNIVVAISGLTIAGGLTLFQASGGALINGHTLTLTGVAISGNQASYGAGIWNAGTLTILNSTISGNTTLANDGQGGGIQNQLSATITNSTISGNSAPGGEGGGIYTQNALTLINSTVTGNSAATGGGLVAPPAGGATSLRNSIIAKNTAALGPDVSGNYFSSGYNLFGINTTCGIQFGDQSGCAASPLDPVLGPLQYNGGTTMTHALLSGSPAIEAGFSNGVTTDQRGFARPVDSPLIVNGSGGDGSDIGAYEVQADLLPGCINVNRIVQNGNDSGTDSLRDVISKVCAGSTITFAAGVTSVNLTTAELTINKSLTINGPGANLLSVRRTIGTAPPQFRIFNLSGNFNVTISGLTIANGYYPGQPGAGIRNGGTLSLNGVAVTGSNAFNGDGGGIYSTGTLNVTGSTLSGNAVSSLASAYGGGIYNSGGTVTIVNSTLSGNSVAGLNASSGGGLFSFGGTVLLVNSTITGNSADFGGGVFSANGAVVTVRSTLVALNTASVNGPDTFGPLTSQGFNLVGNPVGASILPVQFTDQLGVTAGQLNLGPLQFNGGPTQTHALLSGSFALDKGHSGGYATDQRGRIRPVGAAGVSGGDGSDIGAFEVQAPVPPLALQSVVSRKTHGGVGVFDLALGLVATNPTTEPRAAAGGGHAVVFIFDQPLTSGGAAVMAGVATAGVPTFSGNEMTVPLSGVANAQYVTVAVSNVASSAGATGGSGSVRIGFLAGDVNQNRVVTLSDLLAVNNVLTQAVTGANYLLDVNASGTLTLSDKLLVNGNLTQSLPAP